MDSPTTFTFGGGKRGKTLAGTGPSTMTLPPGVGRTLSTPPSAHGRAAVVPGAPAAGGAPPARPAASAAGAASAASGVAARAAAAARATQSKPAGAAAQGGAFSSQDVERVYNQFVAARGRNAERTDNVKRETIEKTIRTMLPQLEQKHAGKKIDFEVVVKDGKVALKPTAK
jgi:hypothetical protein